MFGSSNPYQGTAYYHPAMVDVYCIVHKTFYIKEGDRMSIKLSWFRRPKLGVHDGWYMATERIKIPRSKWREFKRMEDDNDNT